MNVPRTTRLYFRLMDVDDGQLLFDLDNDPEVMKYLTRGKVSSMQTIKEVFIPRMQAYRNEQKGWGLWQVNTISDNAFIGWVLIRPMGFFDGLSSDNRDCSDIEIGWRFKRSSWGNGYASEAANAVATQIAKQSQVKTLSATALSDNIGSINVMQKLGMSFVNEYTHSDEQGVQKAVLYRINV